MRMHALFVFTINGVVIFTHIYTTNAIESLNMSLRKAIKTLGDFPSEEAAIKVVYLALRSLAKKWELVQGWMEALHRFTIVWEDRFPHNGL